MAKQQIRHHPSFRRARGKGAKCKNGFFLRHDVVLEDEDSIRMGAKNEKLKRKQKGENE